MPWQAALALKMSLIIVSDKQGPKVNKNHPKHKASHNSSTCNKVGLLSVGGNRSCFPARWECGRVVHLPVGAALDFERGLVGRVILHVRYLGAVVAGVGHLVANGNRGLGRNGQEAGSGGLPLMTSTLERKQKRTVGDGCLNDRVKGTNFNMIKDVVSEGIPVGDVEAVGDVADDPVGVGRVLPAEAALQPERT